MERTVNSFPIQRLPLSKKNEEWRKRCVDYIIGISDIASSDSIPDEDEWQYNFGDDPSDDIEDEDGGIDTV